MEVVLATRVGILPRPVGQARQGTAVPSKPEAAALDILSRIVTTHASKWRVAPMRGLLHRLERPRPWRGKPQQTRVRPDRRRALPRWRVPRTRHQAISALAPRRPLAATGFTRSLPPSIQHPQAAVPRPPGPLRPTSRSAIHLD